MLLLSLKISDLAGWWFQTLEQWARHWGSPSSFPGWNIQIYIYIYISKSKHEIDLRHQLPVHTSPILFGFTSTFQLSGCQDFHSPSWCPATNDHGHIGSSQKGEGRDLTTRPFGEHPKHGTNIDRHLPKVCWYLIYCLYDTLHYE